LKTEWAIPEEEFDSVVLTGTKIIPNISYDESDRPEGFRQVVPICKVFSFVKGRLTYIGGRPDGYNVLSRFGDTLTRERVFSVQFKNGGQARYKVILQMEKLARLLFIEKRVCMFNESDFLNFKEFCRFMHWITTKIDASGKLSSIRSRSKWSQERQQWGLRSLNYKYNGSDFIHTNVRRVVEDTVMIDANFDTSELLFRPYQVSKKVVFCDPTSPTIPLSEYFDEGTVECEKYRNSVYIQHTLLEEELFHYMVYPDYELNAPYRQGSITTEVINGFIIEFFDHVLSVIRTIGMSLQTNHTIYVPKVICDPIIPMFALRIMRGMDPELQDFCFDVFALHLYLCATFTLPDEALDLFSSNRLDPNVYQMMWNSIREYISYAVYGTKIGCICRTLVMDTNYDGRLIRFGGSTEPTINFIKLKENKPIHIPCPELRVVLTLDEESNLKPSDASSACDVKNAQ
jgi:hypothetical protein